MHLVKTGYLNITDFNFVYIFVCIEYKQLFKEIRAPKLLSDVNVKQN